MGFLWDYCESEIIYIHVKPKEQDSTGISHYSWSWKQIALISNLSPTTVRRSALIKNQFLIMNLSQLFFLSLFDFQNFSPINQLLVGVSCIGVLFLFLVMFLDNSKGYELKRDWRVKSNSKKGG